MIIRHYQAREPPGFRGHWFHQAAWLEVIPMYCAGGCFLTRWSKHINRVVLPELLDHHIRFRCPPQVQLPFFPPAEVANKHSFSWEQGHQLDSSVVSGLVPVQSLLGMPGYRLIGMLQSFLVSPHPSRQGMGLGFRFQASSLVDRQPGMPPKHHIVRGHPGGAVNGVIVCLD